ncbi:CopG family transcriptional regulator [Halobaculum sp. EA56]|uniref:CopG family transcriptional regulator n=1 Tax=Halobaculum sp. EA56 TaxID=3421648 RepID=UPI003EBFBF5B
MAGEQVEGLPEVLREWVFARAEETGRSPDEVIARAVTLWRLLDEHEGALPDPESLADGAADAGPGGDAPAGSASAGNAPDAAARLDFLEDRVDELDAELDEKIDDVRSRVIQVKREADAKADADLADEVAGLRDDLDDLEGTVEGGFDNYEDVLEYLTDAADEHDAKLSALARAVADLRTRVSAMEAESAARRAAAELKAEANRRGVSTAACDSCGSTVRIGLLSAPECPHCAATFRSVEPASGFFGSASLAVGDRPALDGETVEEAAPEDVFEEGADG